MDMFTKPVGSIMMTLHNGGVYDISKNEFSEDTDIVRQEEFPNLIVNNASILMAARMAPGKTNNHVYDTDNANFLDFGLTHLAIGIGRTTDNKPIVPTLGVSKLSEEVARVKFTSWTFVDNKGAVSTSPTNIIKLVAEFGDSIHTGNTPISIMEMGLFGGGKSLDANPIVVSQPNGGIMFNYKTFAEWNKQSTSTLTVTWKITF